jgi:hypothetical protein
MKRATSQKNAKIIPCGMTQKWSLNSRDIKSRAEQGFAAGY